VNLLEATPQHEPFCGILCALERAGIALDSEPHEIGSAVSMNLYEHILHLSKVLFARNEIKFSYMLPLMASLSATWWEDFGVRILNSPSGKAVDNLFEFVDKNGFLKEDGSILEAMTNALTSGTEGSPAEEIVKIAGPIFCY